MGLHSMSLNHFRTAFPPPKPATKCMIVLDATQAGPAWSSGSMCEWFLVSGCDALFPGYPDFLTLRSAPQRRNCWVLVAAAWKTTQEPVPKVNETKMQEPTCQSKAVYYMKTSSDYMDDRSSSDSPFLRNSSRNVYMCVCCACVLVSE